MMILSIPCNGLMWTIDKQKRFHKNMSSTGSQSPISATESTP